ncbi:MAG: hypothetical protein WBQ17_11500 [Rhizomicrobium sp.]|jgi:hypothetical protein
MGWTARIILAVIVVLLVGTCVLGYYESTMPPSQTTVEQPVTLPQNG